MLGRDPRYGALLFPCLSMFSQALAEMKSINLFGVHQICRSSIALEQAISSQERSKILLDIADALQANEKQILTENEADVAAAQVAGYEKSLISRLTMKPEKVANLAKAICVLANMEEPIGRVLTKTEVVKLLSQELQSSVEDFTDYLPQTRHILMFSASFQLLSKLSRTDIWKNLVLLI
ncbi:hypothetical protein POM88_022590 [Heracleum sosnowskyi]|uniref:Uncharacterized protein n=1 Tax=Heracleum sosnowskyi TaxID=360622 RepID=A0AAD8MPS2_9APIA|nr:hypothetical protein POM88_022590 [Heracleum sosnowskyi]